MSKWECLNEEEQAMARELGHDPAPMVVNRVGEEHWVFKNLKSQEELIVSGSGKHCRGTVIPAGYTPEREKRKEESE